MTDATQLTFSDQQPTVVDEVIADYREIFVPFVEGVAASLEMASDQSVKALGVGVGKLGGALGIALAYDNYQDMGYNSLGSTVLTVGETGFSTIVRIGATNLSGGNAVAGYAASQATAAFYQDVSKMRVEASQEDWLAESFDGLLSDQIIVGQSANGAVGSYEPGQTGDPVRDRVELGLTTNQLRDMMYGGGWTNGRGDVVATLGAPGTEVKG